MKPSLFWNIKVETNEAMPSWQKVIKVDVHTNTIYLPLVDADVFDEACQKRAKIIYTPDEGIYVDTVWLMKYYRRHKNNAAITELKKLKSLVRQRYAEFKNETDLIDTNDSIMA